MPQKQGLTLIRLIAPALFGIGLLVSADAIAQSTLSSEGYDEAERQQLHSEIRAYLLENPEVIIEALQILEERRERTTAQTDKALIAEHFEQIFNDAHSYVGGNPEGSITLVEFLDYRCGYCKRAHTHIAKLLTENPDIRLVVKEFPILGTSSVAIGRMAIAAAALDSGKYKALNDALMTSPGNLNENAAYKIAADTGYDIEILRHEAAQDATTQKLQKNYQLAQVMGLTGTPSFILQDEIIRGFLPAEQLQTLVDEKRQAVKANSD